MKALLLLCSLCLGLATAGCGSSADTKVVEAPPLSDAEREKQMAEYDKQLDAGN